MKKFNSIIEKHVTYVTNVDFQLDDNATDETAAKYITDAINSGEIVLENWSPLCEYVVHLNTTHRRSVD